MLWVWSIGAVWGCAAPGSHVLSEPTYPEIELPAAVLQTLPDIGVLDSPVMSADGSNVAVQVEIYRGYLPYEVHSLAVSSRGTEGDWTPFQIVRQGRAARILGRMTTLFQPAFDPQGAFLFFTRLDFDSVLGMPMLWSLRSVIQWTPRDGGPPQDLVDTGQWHLESNELLQHARMSPNGRWLTFYTRVHRRTQGVYLWDLYTARHYRLSDRHDKHPTWSPDGGRIYFHNQYGGRRHRFDFIHRGTERSVLGYYDLTFDEHGDLLRWDRHLLDEPGGQYIYHKHPAQVPGTDLLFFHGEVRPDGKKRLMVRRALPGSQAYIVRPAWRGGKLKELKHPCTSRRTQEVLFIAKPRKSTRYDKLMILTPGAIDQIRRQLNGGHDAS